MELGAFRGLAQRYRWARLQNEEFAKEYGVGKSIMLGVYLWDYLDVGTKPIDPVLFEGQLQRCFALLEGGVVEGVVFCSSTVGDADLESNAILKTYIKAYVDKEIVK